MHRLSKLVEAREKLLEVENVADTEISKLDKIIDDMENQHLGREVVLRGAIKQKLYMHFSYFDFNSLVNYDVWTCHELIEMRQTMVNQH